MKEPVILTYTPNIRDLELTGISEDEAFRILCGRMLVIQDHGAIPQILVPSTDETLRKIYPLSTRFLESLRDYVFELAGFSNQHIQMLEWPRDSFQVFDNVLYTPDLFQEIIKSSQNSKLPKAREVGLIWEGGFSIRLDDIVVGIDTETNLIGWNKLQSSNNRYTIQVNYKFKGSSKKLQKRVSELNDIYNHHIDLEMALVKSQQGLVFLINEPFYRAYQTQLDRISKQLCADKFIIHSQNDFDQAGVNFINLPDGTVIVNSKALETRETLERILGVEKVIPFKTFAAECSPAGGLRCKTNSYLFEPNL